MVDSLNQYRTLSELFEAWKAEHFEESPDYLAPEIPRCAFLEDGYIDEELYNRQKTKVLFVAKEMHAYYKGEHKLSKNIGYADKYKEFWLKQVYNETYGKSTKFSNRLCVLINAIYGQNEKSPYPLGKVALINLNKRGGFSRCNTRALKAYLCRYKKHIKREIEILDPDAIICCGSGIQSYVESCVDSGSYKICEIHHPSNHWVGGNTVHVEKLTEALASLGLATPFKE